MDKDDVFLRAAKLVDKNDGFSCTAIRDAAGSLRVSADCPEVIAYTSIFKPDHGGYVWGMAWGNYERSERKTVQDCRVLALLFAHAMRQTNDL